MSTIKIFDASVGKLQTLALALIERGDQFVDTTLLPSDITFQKDEVTLGFDVAELASEVRGLAKASYEQGPFRSKKRSHPGDTPMDHGVIDLFSRYVIPDDLGFRPEFWNSLTLLYLADVVYGYRHASVTEGQLPNVENVVSASVQESYFGRCWLRLALTKNEQDAYEPQLAKRGSVDFWRSHVFRQKSTWGTNITRAFVKYQYPEDSLPRLDEAINDYECDGIRLFIKQLAGSTSVKCLDILTEDQLIKHMNELSERGKIRLSKHWLTRAGR
jgi:hypothetical protein